MKTAEAKWTPGMTALAAVYFALAAAMYYFHEQSLYLGVNILYKVVFALLISGLSVLVFFAKTDLLRAEALLRHMALLMLPHLLVLLVSLPLWVTNESPAEVIRRGAFAQIYCMAIILAGAGFLYVFGKNGIWLNLFAMLAANLITIIGAIRKTGFGEYCRELFTLVRTFGRENGPGIAAAEINELTFALGLYLIFLILNWKDLKKSRLFFPMLILTFFCYLSGFKRIGAFTVLLCFLVYLLLRTITAGKDSRKGWLLFVSLAVIVAAFGYLVIVRAGLFGFLEKRFGLNTMGRSTLNTLVEKYYSLHPDYLGQGAGFVSRLFSELLVGKSSVRALHNDILGLYIDIGFWGFWLWMIAFLPLRVMLVTRWQGIRGGLLCLCYCLFIIATAFTDNTIYYVYVIGASSILTMGGDFQNQTMVRGDPI